MYFIYIIPLLKSYINTVILNFYIVECSLCYGLNCVPHPKEVLTPSTLECNFICKCGPYRSNQVKTSSLGWALIQYDWCPYKKVKFEHRDRHREGKGRHREIAMCRWRTGVMHLQTKGLRLPANHKKLRRGKEGFPYRIQQGPANTWFRTF